MKKLLILFVSFIFFNTYLCLAQKETNHWFFSSAELDFNSGTPVPINIMAGMGSEGTSLASDRNTGALLFYTNGSNVWGKNHQFMPGAPGFNALGGFMSSAQSCLIVPQPCSDSLFYLFTTDANEKNYANGLQYSLIDMSLNGGNGDISPGTMNTQLITPACEKLAGVHHANGQDIWVITIEHNTNKFYAYLVTAGGVQAPVISSIGYTYAGTQAPRAYLKFSPDGSKIFSVVGWNTAKSELFDFDNATGVVSNMRQLESIRYGASFSPDSRFLYTAIPNGSNDNIYQYDVSSGVAATILASKTQVGSVASGSGGYLRAFQLGIDGKLYIAEFGRPHLHVVNNPNVAGAGCNFVAQGLNLGGGSGSLGLPNFIESYFDPNYTYVGCGFQATTTSTGANCKTPCTGTATATPTGGTAPFTYSWNTVPAQTTQTATGLCAGSYTVTVTETSSGNTATSAVVVSSNTATPVLTAGPTLQLNCNINSGQIYASSSPTIVNYTWSGPGIVSGNISDSIIVNVPGTYTVIAIDTVTGCSDTTTVLVTKDTLTPVINIGAAATLTCINTSVNITASSSSGMNYNWSGPGIVSGGASNSSMVNTPGTYTVVVTNPTNGCKDSSTVTVTSNTTPPNLTAGSAVVLTGCVNVSDTLNVTSTTANASFAWSGPGIVSGGTTSMPIVNSPGTYTVVVTDPVNGCTKTDSVIVTTNTPIPNLTTLPLTIPCTQDTGIILSNSSTPGIIYNWSGPGIISGGNTSSPVVNVAGTYTVVITDPSTGCTNSATETVAITPGPTATVSPDVTIMPGDTTTLIAGGGVTYVWTPTTYLTNSTSASVNASPPVTTTYCVKITDGGGCVDSTCVTVNVELPCPSNENMGVPNAFSPNGDGVNDEFCLQGWAPCIETFTIVIFNRWGEKVYESNNPDFCWNGTTNNNILDSQVFVYTIKAIYKSSTLGVISKSGNISLIR